MLLEPVVVGTISIMQQVYKCDVFFSEPNIDQV